MAYRTLEFRQAQLDQVLRSPDGLVGRYFTQRGGEVTREAKALAGSKLQRRSGQYADGFKSTTVRGEGGELRLRIENTRPRAPGGYNVAAGLEAGTRPHIIRPRKANGVLVFTARSGETVFAREVHHPGTKAYRIMETALRRVLGYR